MWDSQFLENDVTAIDTQTALTERGADSPMTFVVPDHANAITEILIGASPDFTADDEYDALIGVRLTGSGLNAPESWLLGPAFFTSGAAATCSGQGYVKPVRYVCNIPVNKGKKINAYGFMHGSADCGSVRVSVQVIYDGDEVGRAKYYDYREGDTALANTPVTLANRGGVAEGDFSVDVGTICEIFINVAVCPVAGPLAATTLHVLSGNGLQIAGNYEFQGPAIFTQDDITISGDAPTTDGIWYRGSLKTKTGSIRVQAQEIEDDVGTPTHGVCFGFL